MSQLVVTTSWDDGHRLDMRLADLLRKYHIPATFYISPQDREFKKEDLLTDEQIQQLATTFEIGAHTMTHPRLPAISDDEARREMIESKTYLETLTGRPVVSFCYPGGNYAARHAKMAEELGFTYARTVKRHAGDLRGSLFEAHTTVNAYNHLQDVPKIARFAGYHPLKTRRYLRWDELAKAMFDRLKRQGGVFHLWGHSWEIDKHGDWDKLEAVLQYISGHDDVRYVTNGELLSFKKRHVLIAAPYFPPHLGGQEQYAYNLAKRLQDDYGWDVTVATTGRRGLLTRRHTIKGLRVHELPYWFKLSNTPLNPFWLPMLRHIIKVTRPAVVNAHAPVPVFGDIAVFESGHVPAALTYHMVSMKKHDRRYDWLIQFYESRLLPVVLRRADAIVATSSEVQAAHMQAFDDKSVIITPGVDTSFFVPAPQLATDTVLFVGSLNKSDAHKGLVYLIDAFQLVIQHRPAAKLVIAGEGTARSHFETYVHKLGLSDRVLFVGACFGERLKQMYQQATVLALPSLNENLAMVMLEAMASGLPVVGTKVGATPTCIDDGQTGFIVPPADSRELADKLLILLNDPICASRLGQAARAKAVAEFSWDHKIRATDAMLRRAIEAKGSRP